MPHLGFYCVKYSLSVFSGSLQAGLLPACHHARAGITGDAGPGIHGARPATTIPSSAARCDTTRVPPCAHVLSHKMPYMRRSASTHASLHRSMGPTMGRRRRSKGVLSITLPDTRPCSSALNCPTVLLTTLWRLENLQSSAADGPRMCCRRRRRRRSTKMTDFTMPGGGCELFISEF